MQFRSLPCVLVVVASFAVAACGGTATYPAVHPTAAPAGSSTATLTTSTSGPSSVTIGPTAAGIEATVTVPAASAVDGHREPHFNADRIADRDAEADGFTQSHGDADGDR